MTVSRPIGPQASTARRRIHHIARLAAVGVALVCSGVAAQAQLVTNGGFETGNLTGWTQGGNTSFSAVACLGPGITVKSGNCSYGAGPADTAGVLSQTLSTVAGQTYAVDFWALFDGSVQTTTFAASFGNKSLVSLTDPAAGPLNFHTLVTATGPSTNLTFNFRDDSGFIFLDAVSVASVPEPSSLALLSLGVLGLPWLRRKSRRV